MPEPNEASPPSPPPRKRWLPRLRFSLRTLVILVLLIGSAGGLWWRWEPWAIEHIWNGIDTNDSFSGAFSPDGSRLLLPNVGIYNLSGAPENPVWKDGDYLGAFSHSGDKVFLGGLHKARIVDSWSGRTLTNIDASNMDSWIRSAFFCIDDTRVIAYSDKTAWLWNGTADSEFKSIGDENFTAESLSPDGKLIAGSNGIYDASFKRVGEGNGTYFFRDNRRVLGRGNLTYPWVVSDAISGEVIHSFLLDCPGLFEWRLCISPDERWLAGFHEDQCIHIWNLANGLEQTVIARSEHRLIPFLRGLAFSADSKRIFAAIGDAPIRVWDVMSGRPLSTIKGSKRFVGFSVDNVHLLTADETPKSACLWYRRRPEYWWGIAWLPEFWLTVLFAGALVWSVWRDRTQNSTKSLS